MCHSCTVNYICMHVCKASERETPKIGKNRIVLCAETGQVTTVGAVGSLVLPLPQTFYNTDMSMNVSI